MAKFVYDLVEKSRLQATMQGGYLSRQDIVRLVGLASVELFNFYYGKPTQDKRGGRVVAYQVNTQVSNALQPFLKEQVYGTDGAAQASGRGITDNGTITAPLDMVHPTYFETAEGMYPVDVLDDMQRVYGLNCPISGPTPDFPKAIVRPGAGYRLFPTPSAATLGYLALPPVPTYVETYDAAGVASYDDANSTDVGWGRQHEPELLERTLRLIAQATRDGQLAQTAGALTQDDI
ncbi:MAG: hypothetical protein NVS3B25_21330 [Hymenobacter sp.]